MTTKTTYAAYPLGMAVRATLDRGHSKNEIMRTCRVSHETLAKVLAAYEQGDRTVRVRASTRERLSRLKDVVYRCPRGRQPITKDMKEELENRIDRLRANGMTSAHIARTCGIDVETLEFRHAHIQASTYEKIMRKTADLEFDVANGFGTRSQTMRAAAAHERRPRDEKQLKVIGYLRRHPNKSLRAAARACGTSHVCAQRAIRKHGDPRKGGRA